MKNLFVGSTFFLVATACCAAPPVANVRTIGNTPNLSSHALQALLTPPAYKKLISLPIEGWIIARGRWANPHLIGTKIVQSELAGEYDSLALELAEKKRFESSFAEEGHITQHPARMDLLIYNTDGDKMALCLVRLEDRSPEFAALFTLKNHRYIRVRPGEHGVRPRP